jgi:hypothetical protein
MEPDVMMMLAEMVKEAKRRVEIGLMRSAECAKDKGVGATGLLKVEINLN